MKKIISIVLVLGLLLFVFTGCVTGGLSPGKSSSSRTKPAKVNETVVYDSMKEGYNACMLEITLLEVVRGGAALKMAKEANSYNDAPPDGQEYLFAKFNINVLKSKDDEPIDHIQYSFDIVKTDGSAYENIYTYIMDIKEFSTMYQGASQEGYVTFTVDKDDENPLIVFPRFAKSQVWFSAAPTAGSEYDDYSPLGDPNKPGSKNNPVGINETANFNSIDLRSYYNFNIDLTVTEINRGQRALDMVKIANDYNDDPPSGKEYIIAKMKIDAIASRDDAVIELYSSNIKLFSSQGIEYTDRVYISGLENEGFSQMYPGASQEGYLVFLVDKNDNEPFIVAFSDSETPVWFSAAKSNTEPLIDPNAMGTRNTPVPMKKPMVCEIKSYRGSYSIELTVTNCLRHLDNKALAALEAELGIRFSRLDPGMEVLLVFIDIKALKSTNNEKISISNYDFELVSSGGTKYSGIYASGLASLADMYEGATQEGVLAFQVDPEDEDPLIVFNESYNNSGFWFKLKGENTAQVEGGTNAA